MSYQSILLTAILTGLVTSLGCSSDPTDSSTDNVPAQQTSGADADVAASKSVTSRPPTPILREPAVSEAPEAEFAYSSSATAADTRSVQPRPTPPIHSGAPVDRDNYAHVEHNPVRRTAEHPVSTFSADVDTASYTNVRRFLEQGQLPREDAVRVEELINYFDYDYDIPPTTQQPFGVTTAIATTPWNPDTQLIQIGVQGWKPSGDAPPANLVFLVDVSGSMQSPDKLALLKSALKLMTKQLRAQDCISMVAYAGGARTVLEPTAGNERARIDAAIERLRAGGSTHGSAGIDQAYAMARQGFIDKGINRVLLATDGDFNVGTTDFQALIDRVARARKSGVALTTLGFGRGNLNDHLMEQLADTGNGNYAYIDSLVEAQRVLVDNYAATTRTIASDVKFQIEFNPKTVAEYRLIGYENRALKRQDFNNDQVDAGEIGAGHTVTALYEIARVGSSGALIYDLRYADGEGDDNDKTPTDSDATGELAFLRLRYKRPGESESRLIEQAIPREAVEPMSAASDDFRFASAVAGFGQLLAGSAHTGAWSYADVLTLARPARGSDDDGRRGEFLQLVQLAQSLGTTSRKAHAER